MGFWSQNDQKQLAVLSPARARDGSLSVCVQNHTTGAANLHQIAPLFAPNRTVCVAKAEEIVIPDYLASKYPLFMSPRPWYVQRAGSSHQDVPDGLMFDVLIFAQSAEAASRTLATLVVGVTTDMVKRVVLVSSQEDNAIAAIADAAGCEVITVSHGSSTSLAAAEQHLTTSHILCLKAGVELPDSWPDQLKREFKKQGMPFANTTLLFRPAKKWDLLKLMARQSLRGRFSLDYGAILPRKLALDPELDINTVKTGRLPVEMSQLMVRP